jgi:hypothetical protein
MKCTHCKRFLDKGVKVCKDCGAVQSPASAGPLTSTSYTPPPKIQNRS